MVWHVGRKTVPVLYETAEVEREKGIGNYADWGLRESQVRRRRDKNPTQLLWTLDATPEMARERRHPCLQFRNAFES